MKDAERTELLEVVGEAIAEKAEGLIAPLTERLDKFETQLGEVAEKAEAGKPAKPDGEAEAEAAAAAKSEQDERIKNLEDELAAAKSAHEDFVKDVGEKLSEHGAAPKSIGDEGGEPTDKKDGKESGRDAFGRKTKKGRASS